MSDEAIGIINKGIILMFTLVAVVLWEVFLGDRTTNMVLSILWFIPIAIYCYDLICFKTRKNGNSFGLEKILERWSYTISRPALHIFILVWSIVTILLSQYHHEIGFFESHIVIWSIVSLAFVILNVVIFKGLVLIKKQSRICVDKPIVDNDDLPEEGRVLLDTIEYYSKLHDENRNENRQLQALRIPTFRERQYNGDTPSVEYFNELVDIPKSYPQLASLEQFTLMVADNSGLDELLESVSDNLGKLANDGIAYAHGLKEVLAKTTSSIADFVHHPNDETTHQLLDNIVDALDKDVHRPFFRMGLSHANGASGKMQYLAKHLFQDAGKGTAETFFDFDDFHELNTNFVDSLHEHIDDVASSLPTDVEMDLWDPDFDGSAHFPIITTAIEAIKLGGKYSDGGIDMNRAFEKSATKIGLTAGGAGLGSIIGSFILPGVGTAIGAMIGGWLGKKGAKEINTADIKRMQEEFEEQKRLLDRKVSDAEKNIERYRKQANDAIVLFSEREAIRFEALKKDKPMELLDGKILSRSYIVVLRDYIMDFLQSNESTITDKEKTEIKKFIPKTEQCAKYPEESLKLMLSAKEVINRNAKNGYFCDYDDIYRICLSIAVENMVVTQASQALWYNQLLNSYKTSIYNILQQTNDYIKEYAQNVCNEHDMIDAEVEKLKEIKKKYEDEAKTL